MLRVLLHTKPRHTQLHEVVGAIKQIKRKTTMFTKEKRIIKHQFNAYSYDGENCSKQYLLYRQKILTKPARIQMSKCLGTYIKCVATDTVF